MTQRIPGLCERFCFGAVARLTSSFHIFQMQWDDYLSAPLTRLQFLVAITLMLSIYLHGRDLAAGLLNLVSQLSLK